MAEQLAPVLSQRSHVYVKLSGVGLQVPFEVVSVWPSVGVPLIVGGAEFVGAAFRAALAGIP
jgi:hypothetical protein